MSAALPEGPSKSQSSEAVLNISCNYVCDQLVHHRDTGNLKTPNAEDETKGMPKGLEDSGAHGVRKKFMTSCDLLDSSTFG